MTRAPKGRSKVFRRLVDEGPLARPEAGSPSPRARDNYDIRIFRPRSPASGAATGRLTAVVYLGGMHSEEQVVRAWLGENRGSVDAADEGLARTVHANLSPGFREALLEVAEVEPGESFFASHGEGGDPTAGGGVTCPKCGGPTGWNPPRHIRGCDG
jgi:hypothetical protein